MFDLIDPATETFICVHPFAVCSISSCEYALGLISADAEDEQSSYRTCGVHAHLGALPNIYQHYHAVSSRYSDVELCPDQW